MNTDEVESSAEDVGGAGDPRVGAKSKVELREFCRSARARSFAARLLRGALSDIDHEQAGEGARLVDTFDAHDVEFGLKFEAWRARLAATGAVLDLTSTFLGAPAIGVRRPARPLAALLEAADLAHIVTGRLPKLRTTDVPTLAVRAMALAFWVERQRIAGACRVHAEVCRVGVRLRAIGGGEACAEFTDLRSVSARGTAFILGPRPWFDAS